MEINQIGGTCGSHEIFQEKDGKEQKSNRISDFEAFSLPGIEGK